MRIIDVSRTISPDMPVFPGDPEVVIEPAERVARGDPANVSRLRLGTHTGTHVDPPSHFLDGAPSVDALPLDVLVGPCVVADARGQGALGATDLDALGVPAGVERLLLRTEPASSDDGAHLTPDAAAWMIERGIRLIGVDRLSVERMDAPGHPVHTALLSAGVVIVEGLVLSGVEPGPYTLACLPLKIAGGDGAPARAVLIAD